MPGSLSLYVPEKSVRVNDLVEGACLQAVVDDIDGGSNKHIQRISSGSNKCT